MDTWSDLRPRTWWEELAAGDKPAPERLRGFLGRVQGALASSGALSSGEAARYFGYHLARSGFFMAQVRLSSGA